MKITIEINELEENVIGKKILTFEGGKAMNILPFHSTVFEFDGRGQFEISIHALREGLENALMIEKQTTKEQHKAIFMETIYKACGDMGMAIAEYEGSEEDFDLDGDYSDPIGDAKENMSYWRE